MVTLPIENIETVLIFFGGEKNPPAVHQVNSALLLEKEIEKLFIEKKEPRLNRYMEITCKHATHTILIRPTLTSNHQKTQEGEKPKEKCRVGVSFIPTNKNNKTTIRRYKNEEMWPQVEY